MSSVKKIIKIKKKKENNVSIISNINNINNRNNIISPKNWVLPNRKNFIEFINSTFIKYKNDGKSEKSTIGLFKPFKYQKFLRDYMSNNSPYRGILLYHSTGSGKTCTSICIAENLKTERNIVIMLPASLRSNYIDSLHFCGSPLYKQNPEAYKQKYTFISYNANNTIEQIKRIGGFDNKVIIIDEVHNLVSKMMNGVMGSSVQGLEIYNYLMNAQNAKIISMTGTPLINTSFEICILFNILKGPVEVTYFKILKVAGMYGQEWKLDDLENQLLQNQHIDYLEVNRLNKSIEFHLKVMSYTEEYRTVIEFIETTCEQNGVIAKFMETKKISLFPIDNNGDVFKSYFVKEDLEKGDRLKNEIVLKKRLIGLVSYYSAPSENYPTVIKNDYYRVQMSKYQFQIYEILRAKERLSERGVSSNKKGKQVKSTFRVFSRQACNFVFPEEINRPYPDPKFIVSVLKKNSNKNINFSKMLELETQANNGKIENDYKERIQMAIQKLVDNGELYFKSGPNGLDKLSPKMKVMLENIERSPGLVFVYSNFRTLEGVEIFSKVLDFNGYSKYGLLDVQDNKPKYAIYSGMEEEKEKKDMLKIFTSTENKHGEFIKILLSTASGAEGLDLKNIRQIHIMEPYWNQMRIEQVIGRGVRRNSHIALPPNERNVEVFRYFTVLSESNTLLTRDKLSTDEHIEQLSIKKQYIINELLNILKECSVDCYLNGLNKNNRCFNFGTKATGISYYPDISKDLIESHVVQNKKTVQKTLLRAIMDEKFNIYLADPKKKTFYLFNNKNKKTHILNKGIKTKQILVNKDSREIYDAKSVLNGTPKVIGYIGIDSKYSKKKININIINYK
jgi:superfamily II DNA or RNA helicase